MNSTQIFALMALIFISGGIIWFFGWLMLGQHRIHKMHRILKQEGREKELIYRD